ncbi:MAG: FecR family protein [Pyrinomonadaceae bacterium]|nr:FecR family protein [Pyrinomonadaceae bacterium]MCX7639036.1 FecR family protein [Pyrinomonadaceae bacterium]MDW8303743.1 FecR family protein [Acidobacteriota bacterium]
MKKYFFGIVMLLGVFTTLLAQDRSKNLHYKISAEAGYINYIEGQVAVENTLGEVKLASEIEKVRAGEKIKTSADSKAEILLTPGSFVRLDANSELEFMNTSFENLKVKLWTGSALFEVIATKDIAVYVYVPNKEFRLTKTGVYRVDASSDGSAALKVIKGHAFVGQTKVEKNQKATITSNGQVKVEKLSVEQREAFEQWSKQRSKYLAKINESLERKLLKESLLNSYQRSWNWYDSFGLWIYDPRFRLYCFLPFGYEWKSPYGFVYTYDIWLLRLPLPPITTPTGNPRSTNLPSGGGSTTKDETPSNTLVPPYIKVQRDLGRDIDDRDVDVRRPGITPMPSVVPAPPITVDTTPTIIIPSQTQRKGKDN